MFNAPNTRPSASAAAAAALALMAAAAAVPLSCAAPVVPVWVPSWQEAHTAVVKSPHFEALSKLDVPFSINDFQARSGVTTFALSWEDTLLDFETFKAALAAALSDYPEFAASIKEYPSGLSMPPTWFKFVGHQGVVLEHTTVDVLDSECPQLPVSGEQVSPRQWRHLGVFGPLRPGMLVNIRVLNYKQQRVSIVGLTAHHAVADMSGDMQLLKAISKYYQNALPVSYDPQEILRKVAIARRGIQQAPIPVKSDADFGSLVQSSVEVAKRFYTVAKKEENSFTQMRQQNSEGDLYEIPAAMVEDLKRRFKDIDPSLALGTYEIMSGLCMYAQAVADFDSEQQRAAHPEEQLKEKLDEDIYVSQTASFADIIPGQKDALGNKMTQLILKLQLPRPTSPVSLKDALSVIRQMRPAITAQRTDTEFVRAQTIMNAVSPMMFGYEEGKKNFFFANSWVSGMPFADIVFPGSPGSSDSSRGPSQFGRVATQQSERMYGKQDLLLYPRDFGTKSLVLRVAFDRDRYTGFQRVLQQLGVTLNKVSFSDSTPVQPKTAAVAIQPHGPLIPN